MSQSKWRVHSRKSADLLEHLCLLRGFEVGQLTPDFATNLHDSFLLPDMEKACALVKEAKKHKWPVTIFGDYDADGTPASAVLSQVMTRLGIESTVILPTRQEGYGLRRETIEAIAPATKLLITVDTGVTAVEEIGLAKEKGLQVIVLDHHLPKDKLPPADALIDPFVPTSKYPFPYLCGCALAYKFAVALSRDFPAELTESFLKWLLDLVAISTVADMMPLIGENRALVYYGLKVLSHNRRPGLRALLEQASIDAATISATNIGYAIGPRLNASGRLSDNRPAYELLVTDDAETAKELAKQIEAANRERQLLVGQVLAEAEQLLFKQNDSADRIYLIKGESWPAGVLGLVAGKITSRHNRPAIVVSEQGQSLTGSARSIGSYSIIDGLKSQTSLLDRFGGHEQAAGLSLKTKSWNPFVDGIKAHAAKQINEDDLVRQYVADAILTNEEIDLATESACNQLQPFGLQNPSPLFVIENVRLGSPRFIGATGDHLKWQAVKDGLSFEVIGFGMKRSYNQEPLNQAHLLGYIEANRWNNRTTLQFRLVDFSSPDRQIELVNG